jgi:hypothetical protein
MSALGRDLERAFGITGAQLGILRIVSEGADGEGTVLLADLRARLVVPRDAGTAARSAGAPRVPGTGR